VRSEGLFPCGWIVSLVNLCAKWGRAAPKDHKKRRQRIRSYEPRVCRATQAARQAIVYSMCMQVAVHGCVATLA
jgi:hypothetical protein